MTESIRMLLELLQKDGAFAQMLCAQGSVDAAYAAAAQFVPELTREEYVALLREMAQACSDLSGGEPEPTGEETAGEKPAEQPPLP